MQRLEISGHIDVAETSARGQQDRQAEIGHRKYVTRRGRNIVVTWRLLASCRS